MLHGPQDGIVSEGSALDHDIIAKGIQVGDTDDLGENIFDDGPAQACHDVAGLLAVSLLRDNAAVHEDGAAAAKGGRSLG